MKVFAQAGDENHAIVYLAKNSAGDVVEFVESVQPPIPRSKKWVIIVSSLVGCPVGCPICDAGGFYRGKLSADDILAQIDHAVDTRFPGRAVPVKKFKIQFARVGEPALNPALLDVLEELPRRYSAPGLMPTISTVAPSGCGDFFERVIEIKNRLYFGGNFLLQFSIHSTDSAQRDRLIPIKKWDFRQIAEFSARFYENGDRKITLNFAPALDTIIDPQTLLEHFDPAMFLIKITPINPTFSARKSNLATLIDTEESAQGGIIARLRSAGYDVILSIGNLEENLIGSNCGQFIMKFMSEKSALDGGYTYELRET